MTRPPKYNDATPVIFRMLNGECIALFPTLAGTNDPDTCLSYAHMGQHGAASIHLGSSCPLASRKEYMPLKKELQSLGYRLKVIKRVAPSHRAMRIKQIDRKD